MICINMWEKLDTKIKNITRMKTYMNALHDSDGIGDMSMAGTKFHKAMICRSISQRIVRIFQMQDINRKHNRNQGLPVI